MALIVHAAATSSSCAALPAKQNVRPFTACYPSVSRRLPRDRRPSCSPRCTLRSEGTGGDGHVSSGEGRRTILGLLTGAAATQLLGGGTARAVDASLLSTQTMDQEEIERTLPDSDGGAESAASSSAVTSPDLTITHRAWIDVGMCPEAVRVRDRKMGDKSILCAEPLSLGRITIGVYGRLLPVTTSNFLTSMRAGAYNGSIFSKVFPGQYVLAGRQGTRRLGFAEAPAGLQMNPEVASFQSFQLTHMRPGTVSLAMSENDDDVNLRARAKYRNMEFLITTGPAPAPYLDGANIVFGQVVDGLDVVGAITQVPTFSPDGRMRAFNSMANFLGDDRAASARANWGRPLKAVVITGSGVL